ncbi:response regulator [Pelovirga terrestris]|uniref:Response regulator n=1 Tax=Pelovirga terrestris TaxID=2771352 RepID=A0A8J6UHC5_9BACT|nr:response regulator [Pelovirga terrestris]MBD1401248.1 response regulator [Pelovirga terrestris]
MTDQNKPQLPQHWAQGWAHCAFTPEAPIAYGEGETVLLAEKDPTLLKLGKTLLENLNYRVLTAGSGARILAQCQLEQIDIIVFDVEIDYQVAEAEKTLAKIRQLHPATRILLSTAHDMALGLRCCPKVEGLPVLTKPFTVRSFSQSIRQGLGTNGE